MNHGYFDLRLATDAAGQIFVIAPDLDQGHAERFQLPDSDKVSAAFAVLGAGNASRQQIEMIGDALFNALLPPRSKVRSAYQRARAAADAGDAEGLSLRLELQAETTHSLPWELLRYEGVPLALDRQHPVARYIPGAPPQRLTLDDRLDVLHLLIASEDPWPQRQREEVDRLADVLSDNPLPIKIARRVVNDRQGLQQALKSQSFHVLYLTGSCQSSQYGGAFQLADEGTPYSVPYLYSDLKQALGPALPPLLLSTPSPHQDAALSSLADVAQRLVTRRLPAAIALPTVPGDDRAVLFLATLYKALAAGFPIDGAMVAARTSILTGLEAETNATPWSGFVLYTCAADANVYEFPPPEAEEIAAGEGSPDLGPPRTALGPGSVTIVNPRQIQLGDGGVQQIGVGQIAIGSLKVGVIAPVAKPEQKTLIEIIFDLKLVAPPDGEDGQERLRVELNIGSQPAVIGYSGDEVLTDITWDELENWSLAMHQHRWALQRGDNIWAVVEPEIVAQGRTFFERMLQGDDQGRKQLEKALWVDNLLPARYQTVFRLQDGLLGSVPWELLHDGQRGFLCLVYPFYRWLDPQAILSPDKFKGDVARVLVVAANPDPNLNLGQVDEEAQEIVAILKAQGFEDQNIRVIKSAEASRQNIEDALRNGGYQIFHFTGHGQYEDLDPQQSKLWVGTPGALEYLTAEFLRDMVKQSDLRLVFLSACTSAQQPLEQQAPWKISSLADAFVKGGVPAVVAMHWIVGESAGRDLAREFYGRLRRYPITEALRQTRLSIKGPPYEHVMDWANLVLTMRRGVFD
jgi:hypothetical protein